MTRCLLGTYSDGSTKGLGVLEQRRKAIRTFNGHGPRTPSTHIVGVRQSLPQTVPRLLLPEVAEEPVGTESEQTPRESTLNEPEPHTDEVNSDTNMNMAACQYGPL